MLKKDELKNKWLVSNLNKKMFLGYTKLKNSLKKKRNQKCTLYNPRKEYLPFEYEYQEMYKEKYLKKLKGPKLIDLSILNLSKNQTKVQTISNNLLITENPKSYRIRHNKNEEEKKIVNELPFFSLFKNGIKNNFKKEMKKSNEEFLYKLSHIKEYNNNYNKNNLYNSTKLKNKYKEKSFNAKEPNKKIKLQLKIRNITPEY